MKIRDILRTKATTVVTIDPDAAVTDAIRVLVEHNIGALVVVRDDAIRGIISERDLLRAGAESLDRLASGSVADLMTRAVITAGPDAEISTVMSVLTERRIRHLPVVEDGVLCGMISIGDVVNALRTTVEAENQYLHAYIAGTPM